MVKSGGATPQTAISLLDTCTAIMTEVATNTLRDVSLSQDEFQTNYDKLTYMLIGLGIDENPLPWRDLRLWRGHWKTKIPTYDGRREYVWTVTASTYQALNHLAEGHLLVDPDSENDETWLGLDKRIKELGMKLSEASTLDDWQDCGRRSREILVHLSKLMAETMSTFVPEAEPQAGNGKAWMDIFLDTYVDGPSNRVLRAFYRGTWDLAQRTTHADVDYVEAFASSQAVILLVRTTERVLDRHRAPVVGN